MAKIMYPYGRASQGLSPPGHARRDRGWSLVLDDLFGGACELDQREGFHEMELSGKD